MRIPEEVKTLIASNVPAMLDKIAEAFRERGSVKKRGPIPLSRSIFAFALKNPENQPHACMRMLAEKAVRSAVYSFLHKKAFTSASIHCARVVLSAAKYPDWQKLTSAELAVCGGEILDDIAHVTGSFSIVQDDEKLVQRSKGGAKHKYTYQMKPTKHGFFEVLEEIGMVETPCYMTEKPQEWVIGKGGGRGDCALDTRLVHTSAEVVDNLSAIEQPELFGTVNALQAVEYRVNRGVYRIMKAYDEKEAYEWLLTKFLAEGMEEKKAKMKARTCARV